MTSLNQAESNEEAIAVRSITSIVLDSPPSCIEFAPGLPEFFIVGTYHLEPDEEKSREAVQARSGSLVLFRLHGEGHDISPLQTIPTPFAILDIHFSEHQPNLFAIATSTGSVCFYALENEHGCNISVRSLSSIQLADPSILVLSLAWSPSPAQSSVLAVTLSTGQIAIFDYRASNSPLKTLQAHSLEAWTIAWSLMEPLEESPVLYSGGDDSALCRHGIAGFAGPPEPDQGSQVDIHEPRSRDVNTHGAGVTAILPVAAAVAGEEILLTGSYDESLRVLTLGATSRRSRLLCEKRLGGGVWRLKLLKHEVSSTGKKVRIIVLASCMHAGARVVEINRLEEEKWFIRIIALFEEHESMNYASDARRAVGEGNNRSRTYVSTSFYDRKLCIWSIKDA